jgi:hypothetical protein
MDHARARPAAPRARVLEEGDVGAGAPVLVGVEEVVDGRVVLVDRLLHEPEPEHADVEVHVSGRVARDRGDVVDAVQLHRSSRRWSLRQMIVSTRGGQTPFPEHLA